MKSQRRVWLDKLLLVLALIVLLLLSPRKVQAQKSIPVYHVQQKQGVWWLQTPMYLSWSGGPNNVETTAYADTLIACNEKRQRVIISAS